MNAMKKVYKLMTINVNIYYLKLIFTLVNVLQQQKLIKKLLIEILFLKKKDKRYQKKKINCKFIGINKSRDLDYELGDIHTFIDEFKNNKIKELEDKNKKLMIISEENKISKPLNYQKKKFLTLMLITVFI